MARSTQKLIGGTDADPAQVSFTPDGTHLVVTEKGANLIDVFRSMTTAGPAHR